MSLAVIGAGLPRTGTFALKAALERLGLGPCYHMDEVYRQPSHVTVWRRAWDDPPDWTDFLAGYRAVADAPACLFWRQLTTTYPAAKIVLTVRAAEDWYDSVMATVMAPLRKPNMLGEAMRPANETAHALFVEGFLGGRPDDRAHAIDAFQRHNASIAQAFGPDRLLTFDVGSGWAPLCAFLSMPVPDEPFPHLNTRASMRKRLGLDAP